MPFAQIDFTTPASGPPLGQVQVNSFFFDVKHRDAQLPPGKAQFHDLQFTKDLDSQTAPLFLAAATNTLYDLAIMTVNGSGGGKAFQTFTMQKVAVSSMHTDGAGQDVVGLTFDNITIELGKLPEIRLAAALPSVLATRLRR